MSKAKANNFISVFVPVYNGEKYLSELIESVLNQELPAGYSLEFIMIDSGSTDSSVDIIETYGDKIKFSEIPNKEFGHGKTRQRAAELARGEYILFLSQDATPSSYRWVINMLEPFYISDRVGCVFGRQIPRPNSVPTIKREVATTFAGLGAPDSLTIHREQSLVDGNPMNSLNTFFSDVNSAVRRDLLLGEVPFRDVKYAEDQALAEDMQKKGYLKAYSVAGSVWHSNEYTTSEYLKRKFDEYTGLQESTSYYSEPSIKNLTLGWIRPTIQDYKFLRRDPDYSKKQKLKWVILSPLYNINMQRGKFASLKFYKDKKSSEKYSLEQSRKK